MKAILITFLFLFVSVSEGRSQSNESYTLHEKGWIILSDTNFLYNRTESGDVITQNTYPDLFFPCESSCIFSILELSFLSMTKEKGVILPYFSNRDTILSNAISIDCFDSSGCYPFRKIYVAPVFISYELSKYKIGAICSKTFLSLIVKDKKINLPFRINSVEVKSVKNICLKL